MKSYVPFHLAQVVKSAADNKRDQVTAVCCPAPFLAPVADILKGSKVSLGAEDVFHEDKGAFTGGVSIGMLKSVGVEYVLVGHSERRHGNIAHETDAEINRKLRKVRISSFFCQSLIYSKAYAGMHA